MTSPSVNTPRVLFICTGNAGRSQIAQALFERLDAGATVVESAGVEPWDDLHPMAVRLLAERGIDIAHRRPTSVASLIPRVFDVVVTLGDPARDRVPRPMPGDPIILDWDIADPADADGTDRSEAVFRKTLQNIESRLPEIVSRVERIRAGGRASGRLGITTGIWAPARFDPPTHLPIMADAGFAAIELSAFFGLEHFDYANPANLRLLQNVADDLGVTIWSVHDPMNPAAIGALDAAKRQSAIDDLKRGIDLAQQLGARAVPTHALAHPTYNQDPALADRRIAVEVLHDLALMLREAGVKLAIENGYPDTTRMLEAFKQLPNDVFGLVVDTGHANIAAEPDAFNRIMQAARGRLVSLHLNDNDCEHDNHLAPGDGNVDWPATMQAVFDTGYDGCILWEVFAKYAQRDDDPIDVMRRTAGFSRRLHGHLSNHTPSARNVNDSVLPP